MKKENIASAESKATAPVDDISETSSAELARLGIVAHQHVSYEWSGYRYSNSKDAVAAAKRAAR